MKIKDVVKLPEMKPEDRASGIPDHLCFRNKGYNQAISEIGNMEISMLSEKEIIELWRLEKCPEIPKEKFLISREYETIIKFICAKFPTAKQAKEHQPHCVGVLAKDTAHCTCDSPTAKPVSCEHENALEILIAEYQNEVAVEQLAGNVVKEAQAKGIVMGLTMALHVPKLPVKEDQEPISQERCEHGNELNNCKDCYKEKRGCLKLPNEPVKEELDVEAVADIIKNELKDNSIYKNHHDLAQAICAKFAVTNKPELQSVPSIEEIDKIIEQTLASSKELAIAIHTMLTQRADVE